MNEAELAGWLFQVRNDPLRFALEAFPWGEPGTPLEDESLRPWQMEFLRDLGGHLRDRNYNGRDPVRPVRMAAVSGHGVGKSALSAILLLFLHHTRPGGSGTVTASTAEQLYDKTFKELGKWHGMSLCRDLSVYSRSKQNMHLHAEEDPSWGLRGVTSSKENATAIQGQHSKGSTSFYLVDEASGVPDEIFQACYGGMAVSEGVFIMFGNGIKATGEFHKAFHGSRSLWDARSVSCLDVFGMDHPYSRDIIDEYGMDHDVTRVRVLGQFPNQAENQFIGFDDIKGSQGCRFPPEPEDPLILGVDVAMGGGDSSVIYPLRGRDATGEPEIVRNTNLMSLAMQVARRIDRDDARYVYIDETGLGRGVVDRLHQMGYFMVEGSISHPRPPSPDSPT